MTVAAKRIEEADRGGKARLHMQLHEILEHLDELATADGYPQEVQKQARNLLHAFDENGRAITWIPARYPIQGIDGESLNGQQAQDVDGGEEYQWPERVVLQVDGVVYEVARDTLKTYADILRLKEPVAHSDEWALNAKEPDGQRVRCPLNEPVDWTMDVDRYETVRARADQGITRTLVGT